MFPSAGDELSLKPSGFLLAGVAFMLTRAIVADAVVATGAPLPAAARLVPLVVGLGLVAFGVSLGVSTYDRAYVDTIVGWGLGGAFGMFGLVALAAVVPMGPALSATSARGLVANALVGGMTAGVLVGVRAANNRRQRDQLRRQREQAVLLNRLLRHEVLNALTAIRGHAGLLADGGTTAGERSLGAIEDGVERIERTVEDVGFLVRTDAGATLEPVDLGETLEACLARVDHEHADRISLLGDPGGAMVRGDEHLDTVFAELVGLALDRAGDATVAVEADETAARVTVRAPSQWLRKGERVALIEGLAEYDDPDVGYGVPVVRLLVEQYGGSVSSDGDASVTVELPRTVTETPPSRQHGVTTTGLRNAGIAGIVAGVAMGLVLQFAAGSIPVIGALYGLGTPVVGWITHLFHSVVFAVVLAAVLSRPAVARRVDSPHRRVGAGVAFGLVLWLVAAGIVMGLWLNAVGVPSTVPNLDAVGLLGHVVWGVAVGLTTSVLPDGEAGLRVRRSPGT